MSIKKGVNKIQKEVVEKKKISEEKTEQTKLEEAQKIIQEAQNKKAQAFMDEYKMLCYKHGMELTADPRISWGVKFLDIPKTEPKKSNKKKKK